MSERESTPESTRSGGSRLTCYSTFLSLPGPLSRMEHRISWIKSGSSFPVRLSTLCDRVLNLGWLLSIPMTAKKHRGALGRSPLGTGLCHRDPLSSRAWQDLPTASPAGRLPYAIQKDEFSDLWAQPPTSTTWGSRRSSAAQGGTAPDSRRGPPQAPIRTRPCRIFMPLFLLHIDVQPLDRSAPGGNLHAFTTCRTSTSDSS